MPYKDPERKKRKDRERYRRPEEQEKKRKRYQERKPELAEKRKEEREKRFEAFCRHYNRDIYCMRRLIALRKRGVDIEERDPWNAKYVFMWEGKLKEEKEQEDRSVQSLDYF